MGYQELFTRREFLVGAGLTAISLGKELPKRQEIFCIQEILDRYPDINPAVSAVNYAFVPNTVEGAYKDLHKFDPTESIFISVPFNEHFYQGKAAVLAGVREAIGRKQPTYLVFDLPNPSDQEFREQCRQWPDHVYQKASFFKGKTTSFIIGNELNIENSGWDDKIANYVNLYLMSHEIIAKISPESRVFPWQEAYNQNGETLKRFLKLLFQKGGNIGGLAVNIYDVSSRIQPRVQMYRAILNSFNLEKIPIVVSELSMPEKANYFYADEKANFVIQHLVTAAYLKQEGFIERAAWFAAFVPSFFPQQLALSTADENGVFEWNGAFHAFILCQHLLAGDAIRKLKDGDGLVRFDVFNRDKIKATFFWNEGNRIIALNLGQSNASQYHYAFIPTGARLSFENKVILFPARNPKYTVSNTLILAA